MPHRHFPVRPSLTQLKNQARDLHRALKRADPDALAELEKHHPRRLDPGDAKLSDAQLVLARSYGLPSWPRLVLACRMTDAIYRNDEQAVGETPLSWGRRFHDQSWVSRPAMRLIEEQGGVE